jgi:hypothetical protein
MTYNITVDCILTRDIKISVLQQLAISLHQQDKFLPQQGAKIHSVSYTPVTEAITKIRLALRRRRGTFIGYWQESQKERDR